MHDKISPFDTVDTCSSIKSELMVYQQQDTQMFIILLGLPLHILLKFSYSVEKLFGHSQHIFSLKISLVKVRISKCPNGLMVNKTTKLEYA